MAHARGHRASRGSEQAPAEVSEEPGEEVQLQGMQLYVALSFFEMSCLLVRRDGAGQMRC